MVTKTLTITEDAYNLLAERKLENESFSQEIKRLLSDKKKGDLNEYFGLISEDLAESIQTDLKKIHETDIRLQRQKLK